MGLEPTSLGESNPQAVLAVLEMFVLLGPPRGGQK